jgi:methionyl-tRNA formyltransferase
MDALDQGIMAAARQPADGISLAPKITVEDAQVDWSQPALRVDRQVRACTPAPGAWTTLAGERIKLGPVSMLADDTALAPGELGVDKFRVRVGTATHAVVLGEVRAQGKKAMAAADWARGTRPEPGTKLGS